MLWKRIFTVLPAMLALTLSANPLLLPEYEREVRIVFPDEASAEAANMRLLPLPEGKTFAFSTRWDDSNPAHTRMAELLTKHGFKGTFYLNTAAEEFYRETLPQLTRGGHSVGNHTLNHPNLAAKIPNEAARQILQNRVEYEARTNRPVNAFVLPYCAYKNGSDKLSPLRIGEALLRSGELGSPEYFPLLEEEYGMPPHSWSTSMLFSIDDRNPSAEQFDREIEKRLAGRKRNEIRHATLGLHTWQDDKGFATLDGIFAKYAGREDWWYCNENEYNAYRYASRHTRIEKRVDGNTAIFTLTGPTPSALGSDTPLWARLTPEPADGKTITKLPHTLALPGMIDLVMAPGIAPVASKKFPTLAASLQVDLESDKAVLTLSNLGKQPVTDVIVSFRLPPFITTEPRIQRRNIELIPPEETIAVTVEFEEQRKTALYQSGKFFAAVEMDFKLNNRPQRLWVGTTGELSLAAEAVPRDTALVLGPVEPASLTSEWLAAASNPEESLANWQPLKADEFDLPCLVRLPKKSGSDVAIAFTFEAEKAFPDWNLHVAKNNLKGVYLNGLPVELERLPQPIAVRAGVNRLVVHYAAAGAERMVSVSRGTNPNLPVTFINK